ncbi:hypothetical protein [Mesonia oceanica]|uniref:Uncharacterized protein n=1 Tax=Mesonia oceanica TaxID=2687242 RepID=A0AC61YE69_9FLAO|nr:hypothetical protein [Mesonia oceanica]VVV02555.1 hypothetical protein FVB9532_03855 [Mesonia oceanica]|tara:strand:+ start:845 stop:1228 length:384 start_codon:yes stop_codon:yes gene_type:complete
MYIINKKLICLSACCFLIACFSVKKIDDVSGSLLIGDFFHNKNKEMSLTIKEDGSFLFKNRKERIWSMGNWELKGYKLLLRCKKPNYISDYFTTYELITDTIFVMKVKTKDKLLFDKKILKKNTNID